MLCWDGNGFIGDRIYEFGSQAQVFLANLTSSRAGQFAKKLRNYVGNAFASSKSHMIFWIPSTVLRGLSKNRDKPCIEDIDASRYVNMKAWVLKDVFRYQKPLQHNHKQGAIIRCHIWHVAVLHLRGETGLRLSWSRLPDWIYNCSRSNTTGCPYSVTNRVSAWTAAL